MTLTSSIIQRVSRILCLLPLLALIACEAPLELERVSAEQAKPVHRFDHIKDSARNDNGIVLVGDFGMVLHSADQGASWKRTDLPTRASLIAATACSDGRYAAIDTVRELWVSNAKGEDWKRHQVTTQESPMALACDPQGRFWIGASFSTLLVSADGGKTWTATSQDEDMQFTRIQWFDANTAVVAGEFGALFKTADGGKTWERPGDMPNEFYPMAAWFKDPNTGWVGGLSGTILHTADGGASWSKQRSSSSAPVYKIAGHRGRVYALGDNGTVLVLKGNAWQRIPKVPSMPYVIVAESAADGRLLLAGGMGAITSINLDSDGAAQ